MAAATGIALIGPTAPSAGVASAPYVASLLPVGGTNAGVVFTPTTSGNGTFNPATVNLSTATPSVPFTYTPGTADPVGASVTIGGTNGGGLTNPGNLTLTIQPPQASMLALAGDAENTIKGLALQITPGTNLRVLHTILHLPAPVTGGTLTVKAAAGSGTVELTKAALIVDAGQVAADGSYSAKLLFPFVPADTATALIPGQTSDFAIVATTGGPETYQTCEACSLYAAAS